MGSKHRFVLLVCVFQVTLAQRIAELKCQEYINSAYMQKTFGGDLSLNPTIQVFQTTNCSTSVDLIVGGQEALVGEFPHQALLGYIEKGAIDFRCGGSLISEWYVLTAAHCGKPKIVRLGEHDLNNDNDGQQDFEVAAFEKYPKYTSSHYYYDIALVKLIQKVQFHDRIRPACLWTTKFFNLTSVVASGFGRTNNDNEMTSPKLMKAKLYMLDEANCTEKYQYDIILGDGFKPEQLCAGRYATDTCNGDSGGPLQVAFDIETCIYHIVGITSVGSKRCGVGKSMAVYTRVASYVSWIEEIVW